MPRLARARGDEGDVAISQPFQLGTGSGDSDEIRSVDTAVVGLLTTKTNTLEQLLREFVASIWVASLANRVRVPRPHAVRRYLLQHPDLMRALRTTVGMVKERPGIDDVSLGVHRDPEIDDEYLTLEIRQRRYGDDILGLLESLQEEAERQMDGVSGWILVTTDFQPPGASDAF